MKIVIINNVVYAYATNAPSARGGAERFQWLLARALTNAGWSVVVGVRDVIPPGKVEIIDGVRFVGMNRGYILRTWAKFLAEQRPDWWFARGSDPIWAMMLFIARMKGVRGIFSAAFDTDVTPRLALIRHRNSWPLYLIGLRMVDRIFVQHQEQFRRLAPSIRGKTEILPGLVVIPKGVKSRQERGMYVVWVGMLREHKRPDLLVELARATPDLQYVVCGGTTTFGASPDYTERVVKELSRLNNIRYLGGVDHSKTIEIIASAAVLVSTSDVEGFPNIFLEAWASGTPVVSLTVDPDNLIKEKGLGFLCGSVAQAASDIRRLMNSPEVFEAISSKARIYAQDEHSEAPVVKLFENAIAGKTAVSDLPGKRLAK